MSNPVTPLSTRIRPCFLGGKRKNSNHFFIDKIFAIHYTNLMNENSGGEMDRIKTLLDPVSNQIIQLLRVNGPMTAGELFDADVKVSRATLYRKIDRLVAEEFICVSETRVVRGQTEKKYCIQKVVISEQSSNSEKLETVTMGLMNLVSRYTNYFAKDDADVERDKLFMMNFSISLSDEDYSSLVKDIVSLIDNYHIKSSEGAKLRSLQLLSTPIDYDEEGKEKK